MSGKKRDVEEDRQSWVRGLWIVGEMIKYETKNPEEARNERKVGGNMRHADIDRNKQKKNVFMMVTGAQHITVLVNGVMTLKFLPGLDRGMGIG